MVDVPQFFRVQQRFPGPRLSDVSASVRAELARLRLSEVVRPGQTVAITAGSRGIRNIPVILREIVDHLHELKAQPFIVPAMGSHGGATSEGQTQVLASLGVTPQTCHCPIHASMEVVTVCQAPEGFPVYFDRLAYEADHVFVCNRVKPHTSFTGDLQSGLMKMLLIGLGKRAGADVYHDAIQDYEFGQIVRSVAAQVIQHCPIVGGLGIVENGYDETALVQAVKPADFEQTEKQLLQQAVDWMPRLPFDEAELLIIDQIGKDISGAGLDTNVVGRKHICHEARADEKPQIRFIFVRGLTPASHGNATGIGLSEFTLDRVVQQIDLHKTRTNCLTAKRPMGAMIPVHYETDQQVVQSALGAIGLRAAAEARVMWITNTLDLKHVECSATFLPQAEQREDLTIVSDLRPLPWDARGDLPDRQQL